MKKYYSLQNQQHSQLNLQKYLELYQLSITKPTEYWGKIAQQLHWFQPFTKVKNTSFKADKVVIKWFEDGLTNACYNCIDVHLPTKANDTAIIWESNEVGKAQHISYQELHQQVCKLANSLKAIGIKQGDVVTICMGMVPEAIYAMLACARIGAIHSVVFSGFSAISLRERMEDCESSYLIISDVLKRGATTIPLKDKMQEELNNYPKLKQVIVCARERGQPACSMNAKDVNLADYMATATTNCPATPMLANNPLFILYTSGSTNKPKGIVHSTGGYCVYVKHTFAINFDYRSEELMWTAADIGWITGHSYIVYAPLLNGAKILLYEGVPTYPTPARMWQICKEHQVNILYTSPTLIRSLMKLGNKYINKEDTTSLRLLASVGEPINKEAWEWYFKVVGQEKAYVVDTWWQTETGGHAIAPIPYLEEMRPTEASLPCFGIKPVLLKEGGKVVEEPLVAGALCLQDSWPGQAITIYNNHELFVKTYFSQFAGFYCSGDNAMYTDEAKHIRIGGRIDDVVNVSGHRLNTAEIENIIDQHEDVVEAAVIGIEHAIKGQSLCIFVVTYAKHSEHQNIIKEVRALIEEYIGKIALPEKIFFVSDLPKTRSGKIMRRILRKIANKEFNALGDVSTLLNPEIIEELKKLT